MKKINLKDLDLCCYTETLSNGLDVIFVPFSDKANYFMSYATRFGSEITNFVPIGEKKAVKVPDGIAHFLEHKMFEQEDGVDPFAFFSQSGTGANASTTYNSTQYICYGTKNFIDNLRFLIHYVNSPYYTSENVEKEKGIIAEELKMYADLPDVQIETRLRENIYHVHPRRIDIGGTEEEIYKITKEDLYLCYHNFYNPNNMFLLIAGNFPVKEAMDVIHEELDQRENLGMAKVIDIKEKKSVRKKEDNFTGNIQVPKGRHWRTDPLEFDKMDAEGKIEWSSTGNPRIKKYADEHKGKKIQDIWTFKDPQNPTYPTQKNFDMICQIIKQSSSPTSIILDCFAGSGVTLKGAFKLNRTWIGIDNSVSAIDVIRKNDLGNYTFFNLNTNEMEYIVNKN